VATGGATTVSFTLGTSTTWAIIADGIKAATTQLTVNAYTTSSTGTVQNTLIASGTTGTITPTKAQISTTPASSQGTIPASGYIEVQLTASASVTIYWGTGQLTSFQTPAVYNYVLSVHNPTTSSWTVNLATMSSLATNLGRLTNLTILFTSPSFSKQIIVTSGALSQTSGTGVTLGSSGTLYIAVGAYADSVPTSSSSPSTIAFAVKILSTSSAAYAQYIITLSVG